MADNDKVTTTIAEAHVPPVTVVVEPTRPRFRIVKGLFSTVFNIVMFVPNLVSGRRKSGIDEVIAYSAHPGFYLWFPIFMGFMLSSLVAWFGVDSFAGWMYVGTTIYFTLTILYDFSLKKFSLWVGIFLLIWLGSKYVEHLRNVALLGHLAAYLSGLQPKLDPGLASVISWLYVFPWVGSLFDIYLNRCKRFTPNEIGEFHFGDGAELTDRFGLRFRTKYRDVFEFVLGFGGGDLLAIDNHGNVVKRYENIIGLYWLWPNLDRVLHQRSTVTQLEESDGPGVES